MCIRDRLSFGQYLPLLHNSNYPSLNNYNIISRLHHIDLLDLPSLPLLNRIRPTIAIIYIISLVHLVVFKYLLFDQIYQQLAYFIQLPLDYFA